MNSSLVTLFDDLQLDARQDDVAYPSIGPKLLSELQARGASLIPHAFGTLLDHLVRTARILSSWGARNDVVAAGLFHSVYGTSLAAIRLYEEDERPVLQRLIGTSAERLVHGYSTIDRKVLHALPLDAYKRRSCARPDAGLSDLVVIDLANAIDQAAAPAGGPALWIHRWSATARAHHTVWLPIFEALRRIEMSQQDEAEARDTYEFCLQNCTILEPQMERCLDRAAAVLGIAAEPFLVLSYHRLRSGRSAEAARSARHGLQLLAVLGSPWDKRGSLQDWSAIAHAVLHACQENANGP